MTSQILLWCTMGLKCGQSRHCKLILLRDSQHFQFKSVHISRHVVSLCSCLAKQKSPSVCKFHLRSSQCQNYILPNSNVDGIANHHFFSYWLVWVRTMSTRYLTSKNIHHIINKIQQNSSLVRISIPQSFASNAVNLFLETPERAIQLKWHRDS